MILSGQKIYEEMNNGKIVISDYKPNQLNTNSYNLRLHNKMLVYDDYRATLDIKKDNPTKEIIIEDDGFTLHPGQLYLGRTEEYTETHGFVPMLEGRSSLARLGISIHATAGFGDIGFCGYWTLEISCIKSVRIYSLIEICQIYYYTVFGDYKDGYDGKYQNNNDVQASKMYKEF